MSHKHSFFIYNTGEGAYCMGCDMVLNQSEIQVLLNDYYNSTQPCPHCGGDGRNHDPETSPILCEMCWGEGRIKVQS